MPANSTTGPHDAATSKWPDTNSAARWPGPRGAGPRPGIRPGESTRLRRDGYPLIFQAMAARGRRHSTTSPNSNRPRRAIGRQSPGGCSSRLGKSRATGRLKKSPRGRRGGLREQSPATACRCGTIGSGPGCGESTLGIQIGKAGSSLAPLTLALSRRERGPESALSRRERGPESAVCKGPVRDCKTITCPNCTKCGTSLSAAKGVICGPATPLAVLRACHPICQLVLLRALLAFSAAWLSQN